jgi:hypothetical protein
MRNKSRVRRDRDRTVCRAPKPVESTDGKGTHLFDGGVEVVHLRVFLAEGVGGMPQLLSRVGNRIGRPAVAGRRGARSRQLEAQLGPGRASGLRLRPKKALPFSSHEQNTIARTENPAEGDNRKRRTESSADGAKTETTAGEDGQQLIRCRP